MKIPLSWLREYVEVSQPLPELVRRLTLAGLEVASVRFLGVAPPADVGAKTEGEPLAWDPNRVVVAEVLKIEKHPNADKLKLVHVNYGAAEPKIVVTGAPNVAIGDSGYKVILGMAGTVFWDGHVEPKKLAELKPKPVRGVPSDAMVMSKFELGISDDHEGVIVLHDDPVPVGTSAADYLGDVVIEVDVLPNMARCLAMLGVAREVAAITGTKVKYPPYAVTAKGPDVAGLVKVSIADPKLCARYAAAVIQGVTIGPSPAWMQRRLEYAGMRPISNVVDVTNYVMLEWGQPLHAFDYDKLVARAKGKTPHITVRPAKTDETLKTLDNQDRKLSPEHLVIADDVGPIALAGVMGGAETEVTAETKNILLESANFDFVSIRRTARAFDLPSEASRRFSRGIHPETVQPAAERAAELLRLYSGGTVCKGLVDCYPAPPSPQVVTLKLSEVRRLLGFEFPAAEAQRILAALEFKVEALGEALNVTPPPHRTDIQVGPADLIEDLARLYGYDKLPATLLADQLPEQVGNRSLTLEERTRDILVACGLQEVITYVLTTPEREAPLGLPTTEYVRLQNPISSELAVLRHSLLASVLEVAGENVRNNVSDVRLFELASVYLPRPGENLPDEPPRLAVVLTGRRWAEFWNDGPGANPGQLDFFDLKGIVEALTADLHVAEVSYRKSTAPYLHPGRAAELVIDGKSVGNFGQLHPRTAEAFGLGSRVVLVGEFDVTAFFAAVPERHRYAAVPRFPAALRDIALVVDEAVPAEKVEAELRAGGGELLRAVRLFDVYHGENIPAGKKSLAYALTYLADDRTLTDKEVEAAHKKVEKRVTHTLKAQIRGRE